MIQRWKDFTHKWGDKLLVRFDRWFTSGAGVWQTLFVCIAICIVELGWPDLDPHYFYLLAILTIYSAVTQPALAQAGAVTTEQIRIMEERQAKEIIEIGQVLDDIHAILKKLQIPEPKRKNVYED